MHDCIICTDPVNNYYLLPKNCSCFYFVHEKCYAEWCKLNPGKLCLICRRQELIPISNYHIKMNSHLHRNYNQLSRICIIS